MPLLTPGRRLPAAIAALAIVGSLTFAAPAQADEAAPAALPTAPAEAVAPVENAESDTTGTEPADSTSTESAEPESAEPESTEPEAEPQARPAALGAPVVERLAAPAVQPLTCSPSTAITSLGSLDLSSNSTDGSSTTVLEAAGLHVTTAAAGHRKAAGYVNGVGWQPLDSVTDFVLQWTGTKAQPGGQLPVDLNGDSVRDGILVIEPVNGGIQWLSVPAGGTWTVIPSAPHAAGGGGYPNQGTFAEWTAAFPDAQWTSPGYSLGSGLTGDGVIGSLTVVGSTDCAYNFALPPVAAVACVPIAGWAEEDLPPKVTPAGLVFDGPQVKAVNYYQRVSAGNAQGLTGMAYTLAAGSTGYVAEMKVEVNPNADLGSGVIHYATLSTIGNAASGLIDAQHGLWYTSKIAYASPGGMGNPLSWDALIALMPNNTLLSAPSLHLQSNSTADSHSVVTSITSSCGTTSFVAPVVPPVVPAVTPVTPTATGTTTPATTGAPAATTPTSTPAPKPSPSPTATAPAATDDDANASEELPTEAFGQPTSSDAPWWPWAIGIAILLLLALLWFLVFRRRFRNQP